MKLGVSNKFFYYSYNGIATFDQKYDIYLVNDIDFDAFKKAIELTVDNYPEYKQKVFIKDNKFCVKENKKYPLIFADTKKRDYASQELNEYAYYFSYEKNLKKIRLNIYHGVADGMSIITFYTSILYHYAKFLGIKFTDDEEKIIKKKIRLSKEDINGLDEEEMYDPYFKCHDMEAKPSYKYTCTDAFYFPYKQYDENADYVHHKLLTVSTSKFLAKAKEAGVSFATYLIYILSNSISKHFDIGDKPIVNMIPLDCRRIFDINTMVNCADGIFIPYFKSDDTKDLSEVCKSLKEYMTKQQTKENMQEIMADKVRLINKYESETKSIYDIAKEKQKMLPIDAKRPVTYSLSYSGKVEFPSPLDKLVSNFAIAGNVRSYSCVCCTYADNFMLDLGSRTDDDGFLNCIKDAFTNIGLDVEVRDEGKTPISKINLNDLKEE